MKKMTALLLTVVLMLSAIPALAENWYVDKGSQLTQKLYTLVSHPAFASYFTSSEQILSITSEFAASDLSEPLKATWLATPSLDSIFLMFMGLTAEGAADIPEPMTEYISTRVPDLFVTMSISSLDTAWIAATSILRLSETHIMPEDFQPGILLLDYPSDFSVAVAFTQTGEETLTASATVLPPVATEALLRFPEATGLFSLETVYEKEAVAP